MCEKRLIDADAAKQALTGWDDNATDEEIEFTIDKLPTIDAVEVVRCRECRHHDPAPAVEGTVYCSQWDICVSDGGYCHCGEMEADHGKET